jgi:hypothetical protein
MDSLVRHYGFTQRSAKGGEKMEKMTEETHEFVLRQYNSAILVIECKLLDVRDELKRLRQDQKSLRQSKKILLESERELKKAD